MTPEEKWNLMGMPSARHHEALQELPANLGHTLPGNAWCFFNFVGAMVTAMSHGPIKWLT
jgi:hypothetical protein